MKNNYKKNIIAYLKDCSGRYNIWDVFSSSIEIMAISISNSVDVRNYEKREKQYLQLIQRFNKREIDLLTKIFAEVVMALDEERSDILGTIYNELDLGDKWKGQFFTPMSICQAMSGMTVQDVKETISRNGYIKVLEPACGGGATIIGMLDEMMRNGINYQEKMLVHCVDIDYKAVAMAYIQLSLLGVSAVIIHGDSLAQKFHDIWYTPMYIIKGWEQRQRIENTIKQIMQINRKKAV